MDGSYCGQEGRTTHGDGRVTHKGRFPAVLDQHRLVGARRGRICHDPPSNIRHRLCSPGLQPQIRTPQRFECQHSEPEPTLQECSSRHGKSSRGLFDERHST